MGNGARGEDPRARWRTEGAGQQTCEQGGASAGDPPQRGGPRERGGAGLEDPRNREPRQQQTVGSDGGSHAAQV